MAFLSNPSVNLHDCAAAYLSMAQRDCLIAWTLDKIFI
jgi:hypothetical protein